MKKCAYLWKSDSPVMVCLCAKLPAHTGLTGEGAKPKPRESMPTQGCFCGELQERKEKCLKDSRVGKLLCQPALLATLVVAGT